MKTATYTHEELEKVGYELVDCYRYMRKHYLLNDNNKNEYCFKICELQPNGEYEMKNYLNMETYKPENDLEEYLKGIKKACEEFKKDLEILEKGKEKNDGTC